MPWSICVTATPFSAWDLSRGVAEFFTVIAPYMRLPPEGAGNPFA